MLLDRELHDGYISIGVHEHQRHPCSVIKATMVVKVAAQARLMKKIGHPPRKVWRTARVIPQPVEFSGEPVKIVDCFGRFHGVNHRPWRIPVGGYAEHRLGVQVSVAERGKELTRRDILEIQCGCAVRYK